MRKVKQFALIALSSFISAGACLAGTVTLDMPRPNPPVIALPEEMAVPDPPQVLTFCAQSLPCATTANNTHTGTETFTNLNTVQFATSITAGGDWCAKVATANTALGAGSGEIWVDQTATPGACAIMFTLTAQHRLRFIQGGIYRVSNSLVLPTGGSLVPPSNAGPTEGTSANSGVTIQAISGTFPTATPVIIISDASHTEVHVNVDCASISNAVGIQYTSTNTPGSSYTDIGSNAISNCHMGIVAGDISAVASTNNYQADIATIHDMQMRNTGDATAECIHINSSNALDQTTIARINCNGFANYVHIIRGPITTLKIEHVNGGNMVGVKTAFQFDSTNLVAPDMIGNETEGTATHCVLDQSTATGLIYSANWLGNSFNVPGDVQISGKEFINSLGNNGGSAATWVVSNNAYVYSSMENFSQWSGNVYGTAVLNSTIGQLAGFLAATFDGTASSSLKGSVSSRTGLHTGSFSFGSNDCTYNETAVGAADFSCGDAANFNFNGKATTVQFNGLTSGNTKVIAQPVATGSTILPTLGKVMASTMASGTATMTTALIGAGACGSTVTVSAVSTATTDAIAWDFNAVPGANPGVLHVISWPTIDNVNFAYCNGTAAGVTPTAATLNWRVVR